MIILFYFSTLFLRIRVLGDIVAGESFTLHPPFQGLFQQHGPSHFVQTGHYPVVKNIKEEERINVNLQQNSLIAHLCTETNLQLCDQDCWTNLALSLAGLTPRLNLCSKYAPETSCLSQSLNWCSNTMNNNTKMMMIAFGKMIVAWCYDNGLNLAALNEHNECLSMAMFDSMTTQGCLFNVLSPMALAPANSDANVISGNKIDLMKLLNNIAITYQSSTVICMHKSIKDACGVNAADLALGPAMQELMPNLSWKKDATKQEMLSRDSENTTAHIDEEILTVGSSSSLMLTSASLLMILSVVFWCLFYEL